MSEMQESLLEHAEDARGQEEAVVKRMPGPVPVVDLGVIEEAERRGYLRFNEARTRITYVCKHNYTDDYTDPEEPIRAFIYSWLILDRGYAPERMDVEVRIPRRTPGDKADIIVFRDDGHPYLVVEAKEPKCSEREWLQAIEQGFGNANGLRTTDYLLIDRGSRSILYDVQNFPPTERRDNQLGARTALAENYGIAREFRLISGSAEDITPVDLRTLEARIRRAHAAIWAGGKRDELAAFDLWSRLLFAKVYDERHTPNGQPRDCQVSPTETITQAASRIRGRFRAACRNDRTVFSDDWIDLPDGKIAEVIQLIQEIGFTLCDLDVLGEAFEQFFSNVFRGGLGQYFTRRELVRFICGVVRPTDHDFILDPTAGSGGFLLETQLQTWRYIEDQYAGQPDALRRKYDFAVGNLFGIEIHETLARVCKTNLLIHKDGHTHVEEATCLDHTFTASQLALGSAITIVVGNPPFGDDVKEGDRDRLGESSLGDFEVTGGLDQISSELVILERSLQFLVPGGRLGMVVPDGVLNNPGQLSRCPAMRRYILKNARIEAIVSLPDFAFRKAGAQNKTSLLFLRKFTTEQKIAFENSYSSYFEENGITDPNQDQERAGIRKSLADNPYPVFLAEVEQIGYTPVGTLSPQNQLYKTLPDHRFDYADIDTVLGQIELWRTNPTTYVSNRTPSCDSADILALFDAHPTYRLDPKFHLFELERIPNPPNGMHQRELWQVLKRRREEVAPVAEPDTMFLTLTLSQEGKLSQREAGKGINPPSWHGAYFTSNSKWYRAHQGDLIISQIDLWKGCVAIVPVEFDGAIVTQEFPLYEVDTEQLDPQYLAILLRSRYLQRAIRAITTGHSNRRRTQAEDFEKLKIFLPVKDVQIAIADRVRQAVDRTDVADEALFRILHQIDDIAVGLRPAVDVL